MLCAVVHLTLDEGYAHLTDPQIARFAGVSTEAFHKQFASKEECFLAVLDEFVREALDSVRDSFETAPSWEAGVYRAVAAFVEYLVAHEALLRIAFIELFEVGPAMVGRMTRSVEGFTKLMIEHGPAPRRGPEVALEAVTGALWAIISAYVGTRRLHRLPCAVDHLTFTVLAPYLGPKGAVEAIRPRASRCAPSEQTLRSWAAMIESSPPKRMRRVGHKGAAHIEPGNTLASFDAALRHDVDMIELDVLSEHADGSGQLLVAHDREDARARAPLTFEHALEHLSGPAFAGVELDVDVKLPGYELRVLDALREHGLVANWPRR